MDELINRITANVGIDADTAQKAVGAILAFLQQEGPADKVNEMLASVPGSEALIAQAPAGGMLSMGGVMGLGQKLMGLGLGMGEIPGVSKKPWAMRARMAPATRSTRSWPRSPACRSSSERRPFASPCHPGGLHRRVFVSGPDR